MQSRIDQPGRLVFRHHGSRLVRACDQIANGRLQCLLRR
jgi:hypothetical protein